MLSDEDNDTLTRVGPGSPMGEFMRQYWVPSLLSSELPEPDCPPVRVLLLGEKLIAFRDSDGKVGLIQNACPHRGASLFFGRNEECGLRCVYHGWKFDVDGQCTDMPNEPPESTYKHNIKALTYPCVERGGIVWSYLGSRRIPPALPDIEANQLPEGSYRVGANMRSCNWLQALEGDLDDSHVAYLHFGMVDPAGMPTASFLEYATQTRGLRIAVENTEYGVLGASYRPAGNGNTYWRIGQFMFPFWAQVPIGVLGAIIHSQAWVPMDDHHTMTFTMGGVFEPTPPSDPTLSEKFHAVVGRTQAGRKGPLPNTTDWLGRFRVEHDASNDYLIDRDEQRQTSYSGLPNLLAEDQCVTESMGPVADRKGEHLGRADLMITRTRRRLLEAVQNLRDQGVAGPGVDDPGVYRVRAGGMVLPDGADWLAEVSRRGLAHNYYDDLDMSAERIFRQPDHVLRSSVTGGGAGR